MRESQGLLGTCFQGRAQAGRSQGVCMASLPTSFWPHALGHEKGAVSHLCGCFCLVFAAARPELAKSDFFISGESYAVGGTLTEQQPLLAFVALKEGGLACPAFELIPQHASPAAFALLLCFTMYVCLCLMQGHYCPAVAHRVYKASELGQGPPINLKGVAIGNGMTNPAVQFPAYADFALQNKLISESVSGVGNHSCSFLKGRLTLFLQGSLIEGPHCQAGGGVAWMAATCAAWRSARQGQPGRTPLFTTQCMPAEVVCMTQHVTLYTSARIHCC